MGKLIGYITILIFANLLFIATGQVCSGGTCSLGSIIFNALLNLGSISLTDLFAELLGDALNMFNSTTGLAALITGGGVLIGAFVATKEFRLLLIPIAITMSFIAADFVVLFSYLLSLNAVLATFIMGPLMIIYVLTVIEWLIGKD